MEELVPINSERHAKKMWKGVTDYTFVAEQNAIPLVGAELSKVIRMMPTGFTKVNGEYQLVAITSLQPGTNLYVTRDGIWIAGYIPAALRAYPFQLAQQEGTEELILCVNEASGLVVENTEDGYAFFDDQGQPTKKTKDTLNFLTKMKASGDVTKSAAKALADAGVITPWKVNLKQGEKVVPVEGLFGVDEVALNKMDDEDFLAVRKAGGLPLAYAQILSMSQIAVLERLGEIQSENVAKQRASLEASNSAGFSLSEDEGTLIFD
jgi:hypothetical protein